MSKHFQQRMMEHHREEIKKLREEQRFRMERMRMQAIMGMVGVIGLTVAIILISWVALLA